MYTSITLSAVFVLVFSQLSIALPRVHNGRLSPRVPQSDGAKDGCHPLDFVKYVEERTSLPGVGEDTSNEQALVNQLTASCKKQCWPALDGKSAADWDPTGCDVSHSP